MSEPAKLSYTVDEAAKRKRVFPRAWKIAYNLDEAAAELGLTPEQTSAAITAGRIAAYRLGNRTFIRAEAIDAALARGGIKPPKEEPSPPEPVLPACGVYMLLSEGAFVYVGRSKTIRSRLASHRCSGRVFDEARVIECDPTTANWLEAELIRTLQPRDNLMRYEGRAAAFNARAKAAKLA